MEEPKDQVFSPTPAMRFYAYQKAKLGKKAKDSKISRIIGVRPETICRWKKINTFDEWLEAEIASFQAPIEDLLEQKAREGIQRGDFKYWQAMAERHGFLQQQNEYDGFDVG